MKKFTTSLFIILSVGLAFASCNEYQVQPILSVATATQTLQRAEPTNTIQSALVPTPTATPILSYDVIDEKNVDELETLYQWDVEHVISGSSSFWLSDSKQFIIPTSKESGDGIQSFDVNNFTPGWFTQTDYPQGVTTDEHDQVITYLNGLHIFDAHGQEVQAITAQDNCGETLTEYIVAIPGTDLIVTGHQDAEDEGGLNNPGVNIASLIIWDIDRNSCSALLKRFNGRLFSLSVSPDGRYMSYSFGVRDPSYSWLVTTKVYDLNLRKGMCHIDGVTAQFNLQNQLAVYNSDDDTISLITPSDCKIQLKFIVTNKLSEIAFSPNGDLLAGVSDSIVDLWSVKSGKKLQELDLQATSNNLPLIGFSPDGRFLVVTKNATSPAEKDKVMLWGILEK